MEKKWHSAQYRLWQPDKEEAERDDNCFVQQYNLELVILQLTCQLQTSKTTAYNDYSLLFPSVGNIYFIHHDIIILI